MLEIHLCGGVAVTANGQPVSDALLSGRQGRLCLAYLACAPGRVPREELADLLWPKDMPTSWPASLSAVISRLRRMLSDAGFDAAEILVATAGSYELRLPDGSRVDWADAFTAVEAAEVAVTAGDHAGAISAAEEAEAIAARGFLPDDCAWADRQRDAIRDVLVRARIARAEAYLLSGSPARAAEVARDALACDEAREASYRTVMRALAAAGERAEAIRVWERCRVNLVEELGVDPSPETEAVYLAILGGQTEPPRVGLTNALPSGVITFLLTDIVDSSALWETEPDAMAAALERHDALVGELVAVCGGALLKSKLEGDATVSVFTRATSGVNAALSLRDALHDENWPEGAAPRVRMALHTGEAFERDGDYFGPALNRAARLRSLADGEQILVSQAVAELVMDHLPDGVALIDKGHHELRGLTRGEHLYELTTREDVVAPAAPAIFVVPALPAALALSGPFVGRDSELESLSTDWELALGGRARAVLVGGEPGVGKSRLVAEAARLARGNEAIVLYGRCDEELGAPYQPFLEAARQAVPALRGRLSKTPGLENLLRVAPELAAFMPEATPPTRGDPETERYALFGAVTQLLVTAAREAPVMLVLDDLHWAGKTTLALLRHVLREAGNTPLLILATYRDTELSRTHPLAGTISDLRNDGAARRLTLSGLSDDEVATYVTAAFREDRALARELAKVTAGNPFFLIAALRHVEESGGVWQPGSLPEGVREATGRRLSRLSEAASEALTNAAVVGTTFSLELVETLVGEDLVEAMAEACRAGLILEQTEPTGSFRFAHAIVRQVLLTELVTVKRVRMHRAIAEILESRVSVDAPDEYLTDLAYHWFECASSGSATKAVAACTRAAEHARNRLAYEEAADLFSMAIEAVEATEDADDGTVATLHLERCDALLAGGEVVAARRALADLARVAADSPRLGAWHTTFAGQFAVLAEPERLVEVVDGVGEAAVVLRDLKDAAGEARARYVYALALERLGRIGEAERALDAALVAARAAEDRHLADAVLAEVPLAVLWGPSPVTRASGRCLDVVRVCRITAGAAAVEAVALRCQAVLEALRGRFDAARRMIGSTRRTAERLGLAHHRLETEVAAGFVELLAREWIDAELVLRPAFAELRERGLDGEAARAGGLLARALLMQRRADEAEAVALTAERLGGVDLRAGTTWRGVLAETAAQRGDFDQALALARGSVDIAAATDAFIPIADARLSLAAILALMGDAEGAEAEAERAVAVCEAKGATVLADAARATQRRRRRTEAARAEPDVESAQTVEGNAGFLAFTRYAEAMVRGDWADRTLEGIAVDDRRPIVERTPLDATMVHDSLAYFLQNGIEIGDLECLATRGDAFALIRVVVKTNAAEFELLGLIEMDGDTFCGGVVYEMADMENALAELDARYGASVKPFVYENDAWRSFKPVVDAYTSGDTDTMMAAFAVQGVVIEDRRQVVERTSMTGPMFADTMSELKRVGAAINISLIATRGPALVLAHGEYGKPGAAYPLLAVGRLFPEGRVEDVSMFGVDDLDSAYAELDRLYVEGEGAPYAEVLATVGRVEHVVDMSATAGLIIRANEAVVLHHDGAAITNEETFPTIRFDEAKARFESLANSSHDTFVYENDGWRAVGPAFDAYLAGDIGAMAELVRDDAVIDRRRVVERMSLTPTMYSETLSELSRSGTPIGATLVATRGPELSIVECHLGRPPSDYLLLGVGRLCRTGRAEDVSMFGIDDVDSAYAELNRLYVAGEGAPYAAVLATLGRVEHVVEMSAHAGLIIRGDEVVVLHHNGSIVTREERFDTGRFDEAKARFQALTDATQDTFVYENEAWRVFKPVLDAFIGGDATAAAHAFRGTGEIVHDRRSVIERTSLTEEMAANTFNELARARAKVRGELLATRGDWLAIVRSSYGRGESEVVLIAAALITPDGRVEDACAFDADDLDGAYAELDRQYAQAEGRPYAAVLATLGRVEHVIDMSDHAGLIIRGDEVVVLHHDGAVVTGEEIFNTGRFDEARARYELLANGAEQNTATRFMEHVIGLFNAGESEQVLESIATIERSVDSRALTGVGHYSADDLIHTLLGLDEASISIDGIVATRGNNHAVMEVTFEFADGAAGASEANVLVYFAVSDDGQVVDGEFFDLGDRERALAVLDERSAVGFGQTTATRRIAELESAWNTGDWSKVEAFLGELPADIRIVDSRTFAVTGERSVDAELASLWLDGTSKLTSERLIATRGDLLCLDVVKFSTPDLEMSYLVLTNIRDDARLEFGTVFDLDSHDAAIAELDRLYLESLPPTERAVAAAVMSMIGLMSDAVAEPMRAQMAPDFSSEDHRPFGQPPLDRDGWIAATIQMRRGTPSLRYTVQHVLELTTSHATFVIQLDGDSDGGYFEFPVIACNQVDSNRLVSRVDIWNVDQIDEARAHCARDEAGLDSAP